MGKWKGNAMHHDLRAADEPFTNWQHKNNSDVLLIYYSEPEAFDFRLFFVSIFKLTFDVHLQKRGLRPGCMQLYEALLKRKKRNERVQKSVIGLIRSVLTTFEKNNLSLISLLWRIGYWVCISRRLFIIVPKAFGPHCSVTQARLRVYRLPVFSGATRPRINATDGLQTKVTTY